MTEKKKSYIYIATISLSVLVMNIVIFSYFVSSISRLSGELAVKRTKEAGFLKKSENYDQAKKNFVALNDQVVKVAGFMPKSEDFIEVIISLEELAKKTSNQYQVRQVSSPENKKDSISFRITLTGSFNNFGRFLYLLENMPIMASIDRLSVGRPSQGLADQPIETSIDLTVYLKK